MNILVTGAGGQLGRSIRRRARQSSDNYIFTDVDTLDITDREAVRRAVDSNRIDVIVNCAAYTDVEHAETDADAAGLINATAAGILADAAREYGATLIHISTDYVFGGAEGNTPRTERQPASPTGVYGLTKLRGEEAIAASGAHAVILRTAWLYSEYGRNFVKTMLGLITTRPEVNVVYDQVGTPTYAGDLADAIVTIIDGRLYEGHDGVYHYSDEGVCSWYDFARHIAAYAGISSCDIRPCLSSQFPSRVTRPAYSVLDKAKFKSAFGIRIPYWTDSLAICIDNLMKEV